VRSIPFSEASDRAHGDAKTRAPAAGTEDGGAGVDGEGGLRGAGAVTGAGEAGFAALFTFAGGVAGAPSST